MKVLFIGGTGVISRACSERALDQGLELHLLNRGNSNFPNGARVHVADVRKPQQVQLAIGQHNFDVVVNWIGFTADQIKADIDFFRGRTKQYIFISSASVYHKPPQNYPITEDTALHNPYWKYSQDKITCEKVLIEAYEKHQFPVTIVRPSHTYDHTFIPLPGRYTVVDRMRRGKKVIVHGDGTALWTLTHSKDFSKGFNGLLGLAGAIGEDFHITSDEWLSWNKIFETVGRAAGVKPDILHIPSDFIASVDSELGAGLLGDKAHSALFDNSKIKSMVPDFKATIPFENGIVETMDWHDKDPHHKKVDDELSTRMDLVISSYLKK